MAIKAAVKPPAPKQRKREPRRDLDAERHVRAVGVCCRVSGLLLLTYSGWAAVEGAPLAAVALAGLSAVVQLALGVAIWSYLTWARWGLVGLSGLSAIAPLLALLGGPAPAAAAGAFLQLVWCGAVIGLLLWPRTGALFTPGHREVVAKRPDDQVEWWTSLFFGLPAALTAAWLVLYVTASFLA